MTTKTFTLSFKSIQDLFKMHRNTGVNISLQADGLWTPRTLKTLERAFYDTYNQIQLTYDVYFSKGSNLA